VNLDEVSATRLARLWEGSVNHCSLHCRLAKIRGLMIVVKYGAVIGRETRFFACAQLQFPGYGFC